MTSILLTSPNAEITAGIDRAMPAAEIFELGAAAPERLPSGPVWCFVDWLLPDTSGLEVCRRLRASPMTMDAHITMVLEAEDPSARRRALGAGADDYMVGPLSADRIEARLKEYGSTGAVGALTGRVLANGALTLDPESHQVRWRGRLITLRPREFALLSVFLGHPDKLLTRAHLISLAGEKCAGCDERTVDVWVGRLRRSLEAHGVPRIVRTVRSYGYVLDSP